MAVLLDKLTDLTYNELVTLQVIESNEDLLELFYSESEIKFPMIYQLQKAGKLDDYIKEFTRTIFEKLIVTKTEFINKYRKIETLHDAVNDAVNDAVVEAIIEEETVVETKSEKVEKPTKKKLPRRYGKEYILADINKQGGVATSQQRAALKLADLKNIYVKLDRRLINDMLGDNVKLTVEEYRLITSTIEIVETKLKDILKRR